VRSVRDFESLGTDRPTPSRLVHCFAADGCCAWLFSILLYGWQRQCVAECDAVAAFCDLCDEMAEVSPKGRFGKVVEFGRVLRPNFTTQIEFGELAPEASGKLGRQRSKAEGGGLCDHAANVLAAVSYSDHLLMRPRVRSSAQKAKYGKGLGLLSSR
jgi:hypothetical protein